MLIAAIDVIAGPTIDFHHRRAMAVHYTGGSLVVPKPAEAGGRQLGVPHGVLDVLVPEIVLEGAGAPRFSTHSFSQLRTSAVRV